MPPQPFVRLLRNSNRFGQWARIEFTCTALLASVATALLILFTWPQIWVPRRFLWQNPHEHDIRNRDHERAGGLVASGYVDDP